MFLNNIYFNHYIFGIQCIKTTVSYINNVNIKNIKKITVMILVYSWIEKVLLQTILNTYFKFVSFINAGELSIHINTFVFCMQMKYTK